MQIAFRRWHVKQVSGVRVRSKVVAAAAVAAAAMFLATPARVTDSVRQDWRRFTGDPGQACFDHEKLSRADLAGAGIDSYSVSASDASKVTIRYRTQIGDVVYSDAEVVCALREGKFSAEDTLRRREHAIVAKRLDKLIAELDCLDRKKSMLRAGKVDAANRVRCPM
jgi:hypothetical protein